jgi:hypothetical protein
MNVQSELALLDGPSAVVELEAAFTRTCRPVGEAAT